MSIRALVTALARRPGATQLSSRSLRSTALPSGSMTFTAGSNCLRWQTWHTQQPAVLQRRAMVTRAEKRSMRDEASRKPPPVLNEEIRQKYANCTSPEGEKLGRILTKAAITMAKNADTDLIAYANSDKEPDTAMCKMMSLGKFKYQEKKKMQRMFKAIITDKTVQFKSVRIEERDLDMKIKQVRRLLAKGHDVRLELVEWDRDKGLDFFLKLRSIFSEEADCRGTQPNKKESYAVFKSLVRDQRVAERLKPKKRKLSRQERQQQKEEARLLREEAEGVERDVVPESQQPAEQT